ISVISNETLIITDFKTKIKNIIKKNIFFAGILKQDFIFSINSSIIKKTLLKNLFSRLPELFTLNILNNIIKSIIFKIESTKLNYPYYHESG
nr:hypothetical protein [Candidatus Dependentiae bacterium]